MPDSVFSRRRQKAASERGRRMAARRWEIDRRMRERLAAIAPEQFSGKILRRIVVIEREAVVKEAAIYDFDSRRSAARKLRTVLSNGLR